MPRVRNTKKPPKGPSVVDRTAPQAEQETRGGAEKAAELLGSLEAAQQDTTSHSVIQVAPDTIAPHPDNPPHRYQDTEQLRETADSMAEHGVLQPLVVATRAAVVADAPALADTIDAAAPYVILAGHRRWAAARLADLAKIPVIVRDDLASHAAITKVFLIENLHREGITPLEEADGYRRLREQGMTERQIAAAVGKSQSHVHKRLQLLTLPQAAKDALQVGDITITDAQHLLHKDLPKNRRERAFATARETGIAVEAAVKREIALAETEKRTAELRQRLQDEGVPEIDPREMFGADAWQHRLQPEHVEPEREAGHLAGAQIIGGSLAYYSTLPNPDIRASLDAQNQKTNTSPAPATRTEDDERDATLFQARQAHLDAGRNRNEAIRRLLTDHTQLKPTTIIDILTDGVLVGEVENGVFHYDAAVRGWLDVEVEDAPELDELIASDRRQAQRLALAVSLAALEHDASDLVYPSGRTWPRPVARHVRRLAELGYHELSEYEKDKLAASDAAAATEDDTTDAA
ncbi:hypothetical protein GCM10012275_61590 [Longimycelium tulufanense]|uniref:ParB-like N-terminal domain-containing protein n=1 Tax=Longimycelium tulufanense TaxID=907463 RepID=A0A8J3CLE3_9PSEU|nr:ParB/RepB/Spo0J family partition protein [Longimycelium tulufanense]GGM82748.1 hypothetical protein GCM10012275_61590 [Longimycelium tulufanense]